MDREEIGRCLEAEVTEMRLRWLQVEVPRKVRDVVETLGVSEEWKRQRQADLRRQAVTGELHPLIACEQIEFVGSLTVNR
jgi:hypothetical protein